MEVLNSCKNIAIKSNEMCVKRGVAKCNVTLHTASFYSTFHGLLNYLLGGGGRLPSILKLTVLPFPMFSVSSIHSTSLFLVIKKEHGSHADMKMLWSNLIKVEVTVRHSIPQNKRQAHHAMSPLMCRLADTTFVIF